MPRATQERCSPLGPNVLRPNVVVFIEAPINRWWSIAGGRSLVAAVKKPRRPRLSLDTIACPVADVATVTAHHRTPAAGVSGYRLAAYRYARGNMFLLAGMQEAPACEAVPMVLGVMPCAA